MSMSEFRPEVSEAKGNSNEVETVDADFKGELGEKYNEYLNGKSKEELMQMRSEARNYQRAELIKLRDELMKMKDSDSEDSDPEKVLKLTRHR